MKTAVVIVNYRTPDLVRDCLASFIASDSASQTISVIVVDNASGDDSFLRLAEEIARRGWSSWVRLIAADRNGGFGSGNNVGILDALKSEPRPTFVWLLNPDTLVRAGSLEALVSAMQSDPTVGVVGSRLLDLKGRVDCSAHNDPSPVGELVSGARTGIVSRLLRRFASSPGIAETRHECQWVSGASMLVRTEVLESVGLFDEGFFLYYEEVDLCRRARLAGWKIVYEPRSEVVHLEGQSTGIKASGRRPRYWYESRRRFFVKHYGKLGLAVADALWLVGRGIRALKGLAVRGGSTGTDPLYFTRDLIGGDLRSLLGWERGT